MSSWQGKTRGGLLGHKIFVFFLKYFGLKPAYFLLRFVSFYFFLFSPSSSKAIFYYFNTVLKFGFFDAVRKIYTCYYLFGQTLLDKVAIMAGFSNNFSYDFDGEEHLHQLANGSSGGILISAHMGNWEIAGHFLKRINTKINVVMFEAEHEHIKRYMTEVTGGRNMNVIVIKQDFSHVFEISKALENKELICIHGDRYVEGSKTTTELFFGKEAKFPSGPFHLAANFNVPCAFVFALKETSNHYHLFTTPPKIYPPRSKEVVKDYITALESIVKRYPEQWFNFYKFWN